MIFEIEIKDEMYQFNFGVGWMREINKRVEAPIANGSPIKQKMGLKLTIASIIDGDIESLIDALYIANKGFQPRLKISDLEEYIEDEETDIEALFDKVIDFFKSANVTKKVTAELLKGIEETASAK